MLSVSEIFASFQGEGPRAGVPSTFVRLGGCNLACWWCDSAFTWRFNDYKPHQLGKVFDKTIELEQYTSSRLWHEVSALAPRNVVITGGEPMLQQTRLIIPIDDMLTSGMTVEIETAGTISPDLPFNDQIFYNVSPKLASSRNTKASRYKAGVLKKFLPLKSIFKFVLAEQTEIEEVDAIVKDIVIPNSQVLLQPEGLTIERLAEVSAWLAPMAVERGYNFGTRLQIIAYGNRRGT